KLNRLMLMCMHSFIEYNLHYCEPQNFFIVWFVFRIFLTAGTCSGTHHLPSFYVIVKAQHTYPIG
ncbi:MAG TPA: hypothetical protein VGB56_14505, partial [Flavisolibacter sp.]